MRNIRHCVTLVHLPASGHQPVHREFAAVIPADCIRPTLSPISVAVTVRISLPLRQQTSPSKLRRHLTGGVTRGIRPGMRSRHEDAISSAIYRHRSRRSSARSKHRTRLAYTYSTHNSPTCRHSCAVRRPVSDSDTAPADAHTNPQARSSPRVQSTHPKPSRTPNQPCFNPSWARSHGN